MAREGLRVLVVSKKSLTEEQYQDFEVRDSLKLVNCRNTSKVSQITLTLTNTQMQSDILRRHVQYS